MAPRQRSAAHPVRKTGLLVAAERALDEEVSGTQLLRVQEALAVADGRDGNSKLARFCRHRGDILLGQPGLGGFDELPVGFVAVADLVQAIDELGHVEQDAREFPLGGRESIHPDPAVAASEDARKRVVADLGCGQSETFEGVPMDHRVRQASDEALHHREIDVGGAALLPRGQDRREARRRGVGSRQEFREPAADAHGLRIGHPVAGYPGARGLDDEVQCGPVPVGARLSKSGDLDSGQLGIGVLEGRGIQAPFGEFSRAESVDHQVGFRRELEHPVACARLGKIQHQPALVAVEYVKEGGLFRVGCVSGEGAPLAQRVAAGPLDLDHVSAQVGEESRAIGHGDVLAEFENAQSVEGFLRHGDAPGFVSGWVKA